MRVAIFLNILTAMLVVMSEKFGENSEILSHRIDKVMFCDPIHCIDSVNQGQNINLPPEVLW